MPLDFSFILRLYASLPKSIFKYFYLSRGFSILPEFCDLRTHI